MASNSPLRRPSRLPQPSPTTPAPLSSPKTTSSATPSPASTSANSPAANSAPSRASPVLSLRATPHARKSARQLQSSSGLIYDVFARFDPANLLLQTGPRRRGGVLIKPKHDWFPPPPPARRTEVFRTRTHPPPFPPPLLKEKSAELSAESPATRIARLRREPARATRR